MIGLNGQGKEVRWAYQLPPPPGSLVVLTCHDDHRKMKGFLLKHDSWNSVPHLMRSGSVVCVMAMWHVLIGGFDAPLVCLLGFLLVFSFSCPVLLNFLSFLFFRHFLFLRHCCSVSLLLRAFFPAFLLSGIVPLRYGFFPISLFFVAKIICKSLWVFSFLFWFLEFYPFLPFFWVPWLIALRLVLGHMCFTY